MISKTNMDHEKNLEAFSAFFPPDSNKMSSAVDKIGELFISQPEKKPSEKEAEPKVLDQVTIEPVDIGLRPTSIVLLASESGSMPKASQVLPDNHWAAPSVDTSTEECGRKQQPTSQDDHAGTAEITPSKGVYHSEINSPARTSSVEPKIIDIRKAPVPVRTPKIKMLPQVSGNGK